MLDRQHEKSNVWFWFESGLIVIFLSNVVVTFFFSLLKYGWLTNNMWLKLDVADAFGLSGWAIAIWSGILIFVFIPFSAISLALLFSSIRKPIWFKKTFHVKYWYFIFFTQIITWLLIVNL